MTTNSEIHKQNREFHLKTTVCSIAPRHCTMLDVISTLTCSSRWRFGSCNMHISHSLNHKHEW